jgi:4-amino-4-deoxy-L-arabinose transferase-like glycosyltransferase
MLPSRVVLSGWRARVEWPPGAAWIALAGAALIGLHITARTFTTNDEARFPLLAQDILARGDWLWPRLNGVGYFNKPPLLAWLIALVSWPLGRVTEWSAVLPSAAAAVATVWLTGAAARDLFDEETGRLAALLAATTQGLFFSAHLALPDALMTAAITASLWMLVRAGLDPPGRAWIGFYGFATVAFWAKGPGGLLPVAIGLAYALLTRGRRRWSLHPVPGLAILGAAVGLWVLLGTLADRHAVAQAVLVDQVGWYRPRGLAVAILTAPIRNLAVVLFPWGLLAPLALAAAIATYRRREPGARVLLLLVWLGVTVALVALSREQRLRYYGPVVPPASILLGWWLGAWRSRQITGTQPAPAVSWRAAGSVRRALPALWLITALAFALGYRWEVARHNAGGEYARIAERVRPLLAGGPVVVWGLPELPLAFYLGQPVIRVRSERQLQAALDRAPHAVVVASDADWARRRATESPAEASPAGADWRPRVLLVHRTPRR